MVSKSHPKGTAKNNSELDLTFVERCELAELKMQAIGCLSRLVSRTLTTGVVRQQPATNNNPEETKLVTAVSGFPKQSNGYNIDHILKGQIGDDAYFVTRHIDDWGNGNNNQEAVSSKSLLAPNNKDNALRENLSRSSSSVSMSSSSSHSVSNVNNSADVIGVADGVGGWRQYGVDPGQFSSSLMKSCDRLVKAGVFTSNAPAKLLANGFKEMQEYKQQIIGSSTACVMMLSHRDQMLYTANIGDSGFLVVRDGKIVHRSQEQQHYFNTPFQLSLPPSDMASDVLSDNPESADRYEFNVEDGDVIMLATDGIFDNVPESILMEEISPICGCSDLDHQKLQQCANSIALIARKLSQNETFLSPFARNAQANGFNMVGGKQDDVTVVLAKVKLPSSSPNMSTS